MGALVLPPLDLNSLSERILRLRGELQLPPQVSVVIPVNASGDLAGVLQVLSDVAYYDGALRVEVMLVINNYPPDEPPVEIETYRSYGVDVIAIPKVSYTGGVAIAARMPGVEQAACENVILFDADCRIPNATALLDWYAAQFTLSADLAYTYVDYFDLPRGFSVKVRMLGHHAVRWFRRVILRMPISRGSNYAMRRTLMLDLYQSGRIPYDFHVGPVIKSMRGKIAYSGAKDLMVFTSGRFFSGGWKELFDYIIWRIGYYRRIWAARSKPAPVSEKK
jgi:hypothetical protein